MPGATTMRTTTRPRLAPWGVALLFATTTGCELYVNTDTGLGPPGCFFGTPSTPAEFANQCTKAKWIPFDNCARLDACDDAALTAAWQVSMPPPMTTDPPPPPPLQPKPTMNCVDAPNPIYVTGSTNLPPLIAAVQPLLSQGTPAYTVVFAPR